MSRAPTILFLLLAASGLQANVPTPESAFFQVQTTVFIAARAELPWELLQQPTDADDALFLRLADMVEKGTAELAAGQHLSLSAGKEQSFGANKQIPFPSQFRPLPGGVDLLPQSFEYKSCGLYVSSRLHFMADSKGRLYPTSAAGLLELTYTSEGPLERWPVCLPDAASDGFLICPSFRQENTSVAIHTRDSRQHLVSLTSIADRAGSITDECALTFFKAAPQLNTPPVSTAADPKSLLRLGLVSFLVEAREGRRMMESRKMWSDGALLESLLQAEREGTVILKNRMLLLLEPHGIPIPTDPPHADPFAVKKSVVPLPFPTVLTESSPPPDIPHDRPRGPYSLAKGHRTFSTRSTMEYQNPTEYSKDLLPQSFQFTNLGAQLKCAVLEPLLSGGALLAIDYQHYENPVLRAWPETPVDGRVKVHIPDISGFELSTTLRVSPGHVSCLGAMLLPQGFTNAATRESLMQITMIQAVGSNAAGSTAAADRSKELECELVSLTESDAAALLELITSPAEAEAFLNESIENGAAHSLAYSLLPHADGPKSMIRATINMQSPGKMIRTEAGHLLPVEWLSHETGTVLETPVIEGRRTGSVVFSHTLAPPSRPSLETLTDAAKGDGKVPEPVKYSWSTSDLPTAVGLYIGVPQKMNVPPGHREEGRRQVSVIRRR